ncbi:putative ammonium transporter 3 [Gigantopelta aegis]|uniref:putative ammonium transporter 3 n=1 Tax=Gigantopelta aegis TaxID=1735272 RepID=UPI001B888F87|nr:putative ammonium transporter 3 [Gigantopelta aegis]
MSENATSFPLVTTGQTTTVDNVSTTTPVSTSPTWDDATWILTSSFIIFTMQSGFGLLESGYASCKNEVNVMAKNVADVIFGGLSYWMAGYGLTYGTDEGTNGFVGIGHFFVNANDENMGEELSRFVFQSAFATTATTIVSGAVAERTRFSAYIVFSFFNTFIFCFPAHWVWADSGWLHKMDVVDFAGDGPVHLVGGVSALVATLMVKPRLKRFTDEDNYKMGSPTNALLGTFILWWGWLAFNCGSTYGISGGKWKIAARSAANTLMASTGGGIAGFTLSFFAHKRKYDIGYIINGVLASLVSITGICAVTGTWEAIVIGCIGGCLAISTDAMMRRLHVDDPVSVFAVHGIGGSWGLIACGLFAHEDKVTFSYSKHNGLFKGGGVYLLGVECLAIVSIATWSAITSFLFLKAIDLTIGLRMTSEEEELGSDYVEHGIRTTRQLVNVEELQRRHHRDNSVRDTMTLPADRWNTEWTLKVSPQLQASAERLAKVDAKTSSSYSSQICLISYTQNGSY